MYRISMYGHKVKPLQSKFIPVLHCEDKCLVKKWNPCNLLIKGEYWSKLNASVRVRC